MNRQTLLGVAYVQNALSFVFLKLNLKGIIKNIYLYGSVVRGDLGQGSDIDIFVDCDDERIENIFKSSLSIFYKSKDYEKWKLLGFEYPISVNVGNIEEWDLKKSILSEGLVLYSNTPAISSFSRQVLFTYMLPKNKKKYLKFIRSLFGRKEEGYKDKGILGEVSGKKLAPNVVIVDKEHHKVIEEFLKKQKVDYSFKEISIF